MDEDVFIFFLRLTFTRDLPSLLLATCYIFVIISSFSWIETIIKGILHQKKFYRLNLIFLIVIGCGIARFGRRGLKTTET